MCFASLPIHCKSWFAFAFSLRWQSRYWQSWTGPVLFFQWASPVYPSVPGIVCRLLCYTQRIRTRNEQPSLLWNVTWQKCRFTFPEPFSNALDACSPTVFNQVLWTAEKCLDEQTDAARNTWRKRKAKLTMRQNHSWAQYLPRLSSAKSAPTINYCLQLVAGLKSQLHCVSLEGSPRQPRNLLHWAEAPVFRALRNWRKWKSM